MITLTTDWGNNDYFKSIVKGLFFKKDSENTCQIIDITHDIPSFDTTKAAFVLMNTFRFFPQNTIHIVDVFYHSKHNNTLILVVKDNYFFLGYYTDVFSLMFPQKNFDIFKIDFIPTSENIVLEKYEFLVDTCLKLKQTKNYKEYFTPFNEYKEEKFFFSPTIENNNILSGKILYIDKYGNAITNISKSCFENFVGNKKFEILSKRTRYKIDKISKYYNSVPPYELLAFFNSLGYLEIAINCESAHKLLGYDINDKITILIYD